MARIAVDVDSTLYDFSTPAREGFLKLAEERGDKSLQQGAYTAWTEWRSPADACGIEVWLDVIALCHDADVIKAQVPLQGSVETCNALVAADHELLYISNRVTESQGATEEWIIASGYPHDEHTDVVCLTGDKKPHLQSCQYIIDDRPKTAIEFVHDYEWECNRREFAEASWGYRHESRFGVPQELVERARAAEYLYDEDNPELDAVEADFNAWHTDRYGRKAFMPLYDYNHNLTDISNLYLAPTWAGLSSYMEKKGILPERISWRV